MGWLLALAGLGTGAWFLIANQAKKLGKPVVIRLKAGTIVWATLSDLMTGKPPIIENLPVAVTSRVFEIATEGDKSFLCVDIGAGKYGWVLPSSVEKK